MAQKLTKAFDDAPAIPRMLQLTSSQELQVFADMPDIVMTHSNKNQVVNPQAEVAVPLTAPRPFWYLPQNAWGRAESVTRHYREFFGTLADLDREAYQGLSYGAKNIQWFSMMTLWWQDKKREGGTDLARTEAPIYFPGALSNPALWDRTGRMNGVMAALSGYLADSTPAFRGKTADEIVVSTLVTPTAENAVIVAIGNDSNPLLRQTTPELATDKQGRIICDAELRTSIKGVYAGGDIVLGAATVILAMGQGRQAAATINADLQKPT